MLPVAVVGLLVALSTTQACLYDGQTYIDGDEWIVNRKFVIKCTINESGSSKTVLAGCMSDSGTKIALNETLTDGETVISCVAFEHGARISEWKRTGIEIFSTSYIDHFCGNHSIGDQWTGNSNPYGVQNVTVQIVCQQGGYMEAMACVMASGTLVKMNSVVQENGSLFECIQFDSMRSSNWQVILRKVGVNPKCVDNNGTNHTIGSWWLQQTHFNKTCVADGRILVANCVTNDGQRVPINGQLIVNGTRYTCEKDFFEPYVFRTGAVSIQMNGIDDDEK